jgi:hypothetical protein
MESNDEMKKHKRRKGHEEFWKPVNRIEKKRIETNHPGDKHLGVVVVSGGWNRGCEGHKVGLRRPRKMVVVKRKPQGKDRIHNPAVKTAAAKGTWSACADPGKNGGSEKKTTRERSNP